jgi:hypothetical protein
MSRYDETRIWEAVLALLAAFSFGEGRGWKGYDWAVLDALHERGYISNSAKAAKSVCLTEEGLAAGNRAAARLFGDSGSERPA